MSRKIIDVIYKSVWEEGAIETNGTLNLETGEVVSLESVDTDFEFHLYDEIVLKDERTVLVSENLSRFDFAIDDRALKFVIEG
jgi:hypothetical protein